MKLFSICCLFSLLLIFNSSCSCYNNWENAEIEYHNGFVMEGKICCSRKSFFHNIDFKTTGNDSQVEKLLPKEIKRINGENCNLISVYFDEDEYGVSSHSFGKILAAADDIYLIDIKYLVNTCACEGRDMYVSNYLIVHKDEFIVISTGRNKKILNMNLVKDFVLKAADVNLSTDVNNLESLADFIKNINNQ